MKDERYWPVLGTWLKDTAEAPPDPRQTARKVADRLPHTPQLRSRWWLPSLRRTPPPPHGRDQTTDHQPVPISIMTDRFASATGRTRLMFSPVKAIAAGALVFALGGMFLIAQPFDQGGSFPGAKQAPEAPIAVEVTKALGLGECEEPTETSFVCEVLHEWSDPRLQGTSLALENNKSIELPDGDELAIFNNIYNIETADGAWRMRPQLRFEFEGSPELEEGPRWWVLDGDGDYEGMSLLLIRDRREGGDEPLRGFIVSTDLLPPAPEGASTK
jgi:hypothetical protein